MAFSEREDGVNKLKTIAHPLRLEIVKCLFKNKKMSVTEIQTDLNLQQPVVSHLMLSILKTDCNTRLMKALKGVSTRVNCLIW